ncbi:hypothetical protein [Terrisporobacter mayombei]|uniref:Uncharacterized protein n=1 Tax=Terrisporobacter mayombei TaxID=1541 RepID=A0ABY9Q1S1_9FIRM|nr:hypothetical protein [Terrisporobacter mayombei]MCC3866976.1 hypothetical protein [Terrisporobacter mayombei]WMT81225.1 hypothetical protein TEMA_15590 [Terrisporobacter mayombei]
MRDGKKYIYNPEQARFYISNGIMPVRVDVHRQTKKMFFIFNYDETKEVYLQWLNRKH